MRAERVTSTSFDHFIGCIAEAEVGSALRLYGLLTLPLNQHFTLPAAHSSG